MITRILLAGLIVFAVSANSFAQFPEPMPMPMPGPGQAFGGGMQYFEKALIFPGPPEELIRGVQQALGLTDTQVNAVSALVNVRTETTRGLYQEMAEKQRALNELMSHANPSALDIGNAFLAVQAVQSQLRAAEEKFQTDFQALLTPDQRATIERLKTASTQIEALRRFGVFGNDGRPGFVMPLPPDFGGGVGIGGARDRVFGPVPVPPPGAGTRVIVTPRGR